MLEGIYFGSLAILLYVYGGYYGSLKLASRIRRFLKQNSSGQLPGGASFSRSVSIIVAAFNEEASIAGRIENLLTCSYQGEVEIIIASDGSTDGTVEIARRYTDRNVLVLDYGTNRGRAAVHNDAVAAASGEILIFTDAETVFEDAFITKIVSAFARRTIGAAVGRLVWYHSRGGIQQGENLYWGWEVKTRILQNELGCLMTGSGACTAVRRALFKPLRPVDDVDFATTIDVIVAGYKIAYVGEAIAYDRAPGTLKAELHGRMRASKRMVGTLSRWGMCNYLRHPIYSWTLISHKVLRWLSPVFILGMVISNLMLIGTPLYNVSMVLITMALLLVLIGAVSHLFDKKVPLASTVFSFSLAVYGFLLALLRILMRRVPVRYKMPD